jgi:DNA-binding transcriptional LysR family regulator
MVMPSRLRRVRQLRLRDLRLLDEIERHGTLQRVAQALFVSQPAVSQALRSLETAVGVPLALRSRRGVALTEAGRALRVHLLAADASLAAGLGALDAEPPLPELRIGTIPYALHEALPGALARLGRAPFTLRITTGAVGQLLRQLTDGDVDAVLVRLEPQRSSAPSRSAHPALHTVPVTVLRFVAVCGRDHPLARRRRVDLAALADADWVLPDSSAAARQTVDDLFARAGLPGPRARIVSGNYSDNLRIAVAAGLLTIAPLDVVAAMRPQPKVLLAPPEWETSVVLAYLAHRADWPPLAALRAALAPSAADRPADRPAPPRHPPGRSTGRPSDLT